MLLVWTGNTCPHYKTKEMPLLRRFIMKRKELFNMLFGDSELDVFGCARLSCKSERCEECKFHGYWEQPVVISKEVVKYILNSAYGKYYQYYDTDSIYFQYGGRGNGKTYAQHLALTLDGWSKFPSLHNNIEWSMLKDIIDDALDNGFEVKILNGTIYYREKQ